MNEDTKPDEDEAPKKLFFPVQNSQMRNAALSIIRAVAFNMKTTKERLAGERFAICPQSVSHCTWVIENVVYRTVVGVEGGS